MSLEQITSQGKVLAILVDATKIEDNLKFISPNEFPLQVGVHNKSADFYISAHEHIPFDKLENHPSQEIFYVTRGRIQVGLYDGNKRITERILSPGYLIILNCGHDVKFLEDSQIVEVKQGPYRGRENEKREIKYDN
jgi:hypothetical protein